MSTSLFERLWGGAAERPRRPERNAAYPTKQQIALTLLSRFRAAFPDLTIQAVLADTLYVTQTFLDDASALFGGPQVISQ